MSECRIGCSPANGRRREWDVEERALSAMQWTSSSTDTTLANALDKLVEGLGVRDFYIQANASRRPRPSASCRQSPKSGQHRACLAASLIT